MAYDIGTARGVIEMEYNGRGVQEAVADVEGLEKKGGSATEAFGQVGRTAGIAGAAIATGLAAGVYAAANFEQRMSAVKAVSGATAGEMDSLSAKALQLGKDTSFSATESASAIEELVKAGLSVDDVLNGAADATVALAAAGEIALPEAASIAANAMNQFNLSAEDMVNVTDNIAGAANSSAIDVSDFGQSLQQVGAVANLAGVSFDDTATAIALLGNAGIKGSDAGTSLKSMFSRLQPTTQKQIDTMMGLNLLTLDTGKSMQVLAQNGMKPASDSTKDVQAAMAQLGAEMSNSEVGSAKQAKATQDLMLKTGALSNAFYDEHGNLKNLSAVSGALQKSLKGMTAQQKQAALQTLFGSDAIRAAAILSNEGAKGFDKMAASMEKTSAAQVAADRLDNFNGKLEQLKGSVETAGITVGGVFLPALTSMVNGITAAVNAFLNLGSGTQKFIAVALASVAGILLMAAAIIKIVTFVMRLRAALILIRAAFATTWVAALGPIALVIAAVAAIVAIIVYLWKTNDTFRNAIITAWNAIKSAVQAVMGFFGSIPGAFEAVWNAIKGGVSAVVAFIGEHWRTLISIFLGPLGMVIALVTKFWPQITAAFSAGIAVLRAIWQGFWNTFGGVITAAWNVVVQLVRLGWIIVRGLFIAFMQGIVTLMRAGWAILTGVVRVAWAAIRAVVSAGVAVVRSVVSAGMNAVRAVFSAVWNAVAAVVSAVWGRIGGTVMAGVSRVRSAISSAWNAVKSITTSTWNAVVSVISSAVGRIGETVGRIFGIVTGALAGAGSWLVNAGAELVQGLIDGITSKLDDVAGAISSVAGKVKGFLPGSPVKEGPLKVLNRGHSGKEIVQMVIEGIADMATPLQDAMDSAMPSVAAPGIATPAPGTTPRPRGRGARGGPRELRMVRGHLSLDKSGRAFITGVAEESVHGDDDYGDTIERMG
jgi:phage-related protein